VPEPLFWAEDIRPEWIDYNGHLSEAYYVLVFGHATDAAMGRLGMTPQYLRDTGTSLFTLEAHIRYLDQVPPGARPEVRSSVIGSRILGRAACSGGDDPCVRAPRAGAARGRGGAQRQARS
jgi:acyl-CoA thioesterase FadM